MAKIIISKKKSYDVTNQISKSESKLVQQKVSESECATIQEEKVNTARLFDPVINSHPQETEDRGCRKVSENFLYCRSR